MPKISPKSPELLQAQLATFSAEHLVDYTDNKHVLAHLGNLALGDQKEITRTTEDTEYRRLEEGQRPIRVTGGTELQVATNKEYQDFLRSVGGSQYETVQRRAEMYANYERFAPQIATLRAQLSDVESRDSHEALVGSGSNSRTFSIEEDGKKYIVRVPRDGHGRPDIIDTHIAGAVLAKGLPHFEQIVAASYEEGVTVAEVMPGRELDQLTSEDLSHISNQQLEEFIDTLVIANKRGIEIDPKPSNIFYDREDGFGVIDFGSERVKSKTTADQDLSIIGWTASSLQSLVAGDGGSPRDKSEADYRQEVERAKIVYNILNRYKNAVEAKLGSEEIQEALQYINVVLGGMRNIATNPEWVEQRLAQDAAWKEQRRSQSSQIAAMRTDDFV